MILSKKFKTMFKILLGISIIIYFYVVPVRSTTSYITSLSPDCVNTFTVSDKDISEEVKPPINIETEAQDTGDINHSKWYITGMLISILGMVLIRKLNHKKGENKNENE